MKDPFKQWLTTLPRINGLKACGIRFADRECISRTPAGELSADKVQEILESLAEIFPALATRGSAGQRQRWAFDRACLHVAVRPDGVLLAAITTPEGDEAATTSLLESFCEFTPA